MTPDEVATALARQYGGVEAGRAAELLRLQASRERGDDRTAIPRRLPLVPDSPENGASGLPGGKKPRQKAMRVVVDVPAAVKIFYTLLQHAGIVLPVPEYRFSETGRKWRWDFAWPAYRVALEVSGGAFLAGGGRHTRGVGFRNDCEKYSIGAVEGWRVIHVLPEQLALPETVDWIKRALSYSS